MRLFAAILLLILVQVSTAGFAQRISVSRSNATLKTILKEIKSKTDFDFLCTDEMFKKSNRVSVHVKNMDLKDLLKQVFETQPLTYVIDSKTILVREKPINERYMPKQVVPSVKIPTVTGRVLDENNVPLPGAIIRLKKEKKSYPANKNGEFSVPYLEKDELAVISFVGYTTKEVPLKVIQANPLVILNASVNKLDEIGVIKLIIGTQINLKNRTHQNLAQVLEGGVPGLTLKRDRRSQEGYSYSTPGGETKVFDMAEYEAWKTANPEQASGTPDFDSWLKSNTSEEVLKTIKSLNLTLTKSTKTIDNGIVPQLRGTSNFSGNTSGMLVIIDGFPQDGFPANYPMNNVAAIEIIRDPEECLKWGSRGANGVILITTNLAKAGELRFNYNTNLYFSPPPDISANKLRLASSADLLDYYKEAYDKKIAIYIPEKPADPMPPQLSPAQMILFDLAKGKINQGVFQSKWDSLSEISNRGQMRMLKQHTFNQNHSLSVFGGTEKHRFNINGLYDVQRSASLYNDSQMFGLSLRDNRSMLADKLKINLLANLNDFRKRTSPEEDGRQLDPYQLLLDDKGHYIYNAGNVTPDNNRDMLKYGYYENGSNLLEDIRSNSNISKSMQVNSAMDVNWKLLPGLQWSVAGRYSHMATREENLAGATSSQTRELINKYGSPVYGDPAAPAKITGVDFYVPYGGILKRTKLYAGEYSLRSGFSFNQTIGSRHRVMANLDAGLASHEERSRPDQPIYGYNVSTSHGIPLQDYAGIPAKKNYFGADIDPKQLFVADLNTNSYYRNVTLNANLLYNYLDRYSLNVGYASVMIPSLEQGSPYSTTSSRFAAASWLINKEKVFRTNWISNIWFTIKAAEMRVAKLPVSLVNATRIVQSVWGNSAIRVNSYNVTEQSGQKNQTLEAELKADFSQEHLQLKLGYIRNSIGQKHQWNVRLFYDMAREPYFHSRLISSLQFDAGLLSINPYQGLAIVMKSNALSSGGTFDASVNDNLGLLPPDIRNKEAHFLIGLAKDRFTLDMRYYHKTISGLSYGVLATDPSTGLSSRVNYSKILNSGLEVSFRAGVIQRKAFSWTTTLNGAYNMNQAIDVPPLNFSLSSTYMGSTRNGYSPDNLWSFSWAGLDRFGNPQVYNGTQKSTLPDSSSLVYSGRTRAPWSGAVIQEWRYKGFFANARLMFNLGHVMRKYMPVLSSLADKDIAIRDRWRKPGDEAFTDVAAVAADDNTRALVIQNSSNSIVSANHMRLREVQIGYEVPQDVLKGRFFKSLTFSVQVENVALWTRNTLHIDPEVVSSNGLVGITPPRTYMLSIAAAF